MTMDPVDPYGHVGGRPLPVMVLAVMSKSHDLDREHIVGTAVGDAVVTHAHPLASLTSLGLTDREAEIVAQVATGASNAEVARHLHVAPGTVKRHLENVYRKLGIHGRGQLIAFVVETLGAAGTTGGDRRTP